MTTKRILAEKDWEKENLEREVTSSKNIISVLQIEKEEMEKEFANMQRELASSSMAIVPGSTGEESEQLLSAKQEAALWEESYNFAVQEKEDKQKDLLKLEDKLAGLQAESEKLQREILNCNKNYSIKVSEAGIVQEPIRKDD